MTDRPQPSSQASPKPDATGHLSADAASTDHDPDHGVGHEAEALGPIDWTAWSVGALGVAVGLVVAVCFAISAGVL